MTEWQRLCRIHAAKFFRAQSSSCKFLLSPLIFHYLRDGSFKINSKSCKRIVRKFFEFLHKSAILFWQKYIILQQNVENDVFKVKEREYFHSENNRSWLKHTWNISGRECFAVCPGVLAFYKSYYSVTAFFLAW